ncbi:hypothetical protein ACFL7M_13660 [Thermodesulfobacteriota bacterium]
MHIDKQKLQLQLIFMSLVCANEGALFHSGNDRSSRLTLRGLNIVRAIADNDMKTANKLIDKYQVVPGEQAIENEILKRKLSQKEWP